MSLLARAFGNGVPGAPPGPLGFKSLGVGGEPRQGYLSKTPDYFASNSSPCVRTTSVRFTHTVRR